MGNVPKGATYEQIDILRTEIFAECSHNTHSRMSEQMSSDQTACSICLLDYSEGELLRVLQCEHRYHAHCVDRWLRGNIKCPVCKKEQDFCAK